MDLHLKTPSFDDCVCDFCSAPGPHWVYEAEDFRMGTTVVGNATFNHSSRGAWGACQPCRDFIEAGDRKGLLRRSVEALVEGGAPADLVEFFAANIKVAHDGFFANRLPTPPALRQRPVGSA